MAEKRTDALLDKNERQQSRTRQENKYFMPRLETAIEVLLLVSPVERAHQPQNLSLSLTRDQPNPALPVVTKCADHRWSP